MKNILDRELTSVKLRHLIVGVLLLLAAVVLVSTGTVMVAQAAIPPNKFWTQGTIRMAAAYDTLTKTISPSAYTDVLTVDFTVPDGQKADIAAFFNGQIIRSLGGGYNYCFGKLVLDSSTELHPGYRFLIGDTTPPTQIAATFEGYTKGVAAGTHTLHAQIAVSYGSCELDARSLIVIANLHN